MSVKRFITQVSEERFAKLPVYAQDEIAVSRRYIDELEAELAALVAPDHSVTTHADPHADRPKPIGDNPTVRHRLADGSEVEMQCQPHKVTVSANGASFHQRMTIVPQVSNVVDIVVSDETSWPQDPRPKPSDTWKVTR
jgi:plasmid stabilization system protein ParE